MQIDKQQVLDMIRQVRGDQDAQQADQELPQKVDHERDAGLLQKYGIDPGDLVKRFTGGGGIPGF